MTHKTLINGTAYSISGGRTLINGTGYNISGGRTLVSGTGYDISFGSSLPAYAMYYSDNSMVFQMGSKSDTSKTLTASYTGFEDASYISSNVPWSSKLTTLTSVSFNDEINPTSLAYWFYNAQNLTSNIQSFSNLNISKTKDMGHAFYNCQKLTGSPVCSSNVWYMPNTYYNCQNLTGSPICGTKVTSMIGTYNNCQNLTGSPVCGNNVTTMASTYYNCIKLTGAPACGANVTNMRQTYYNCQNLTGTPVCGDKVTTMCQAYYNCYNLTGAPACGANVTNMGRAYRNCKNLTGNVYFRNASMVNVQSCFEGKDNAKRINIYVPAGSTTNTKCACNNSSSLVGWTITWTANTSNKCYYNTKYNIYVYYTL